MAVYEIDWKDYHQGFKNLLEFNRLSELDPLAGLSFFFCFSQLSSLFILSSSNERQLNSREMITSLSALIRDELILSYYERGLSIVSFYLYLKQ